MINLHLAIGNFGVLVNFVNKELKFLKIALVIWGNESIFFQKIRA